MNTCVILCTFNGEKYIREQILSIINQTLRFDKMIIIDDASSDNTVKIIKQTIFGYNNIHLIQNAQNKGYIQNFTKAIEHRENNFIFFSDQDDIWDKYKIEKTINFLSNNPDIQVVFSDGYIINNKKLSLWSNFKFDYHDDCETIFQKLLHHDFLTGAAMCAKTSFLEKAMPIPQGFYHDKWFALCAAISNSLGLINEKLIGYRVHNAQNTGLKTTGIFKKIKKSNTINIEKEIIKLKELEYKFKNYSTVENLILLKNKIKFFEARLNYPSNFLTRSLLILKNYEFYFTFSSGLNSLIKDLLFHRR